MLKDIYRFLADFISLSETSISTVQVWYAEYFYLSFRSDCGVGIDGVDNGAVKRARTRYQSASKWNLRIFKRHETDMNMHINSWSERQGMLDRLSCISTFWCRANLSSPLGPLQHLRSCLAWHEAATNQFPMWKKITKAEMRCCAWCGLSQFAGVETWSGQWRRAMTDHKLSDAVSTCGSTINNMNMVYQPCWWHSRLMRSSPLTLIYRMCFWDFERCPPKLKYLLIESCGDVPYLLHYTTYTCPQRLALKPIEILLQLVYGLQLIRVKSTSYAGLWHQVEWGH